MINWGKELVLILNNKQIGSICHLLLELLMDPKAKTVIKITQLFILTLN
jgi:hypothetical protein